MRIGILTFHRSINYGAFMQSYALSKEIQKRYGDIVEIIDFEHIDKTRMYRPDFRKFIRHGMAYHKMFSRFRDDLCLLPLSPDAFITDDYSRIYEYINGRYDLVIVGSDAVWAYNHHLGLRNPYWLGPEIKCMKMSYAASAYSLDVKKVSSEERKYIAECLEGYAYIGVRDQETFDFVQSVGSGKEVNLNCDPTVLLPKPDVDMGKCILARLGVDVSKKIVSFMISGNPYVDVIQKKLGRDYEYVMLLSQNRISDRLLPKGRHFLCDLSPYEWYTVFSCFCLNITKYFHGTLLALKSGVPTVSFDVTRMNYEYKSKIKQLMSDMHLEQFWINNKDCSMNQIWTAIKYILENREEVERLINASMEEEKKKSVSFFRALDGIIRNQK